MGGMGKIFWLIVAPKRSAIDIGRSVNLRKLSKNYSWFHAVLACCDVNQSYMVFLANCFCMKVHAMREASGPLGSL
jgi:hypothetical protein